MIFILNLVVISMLLRWHITLMLIIAGVICSIEYFKWQTGMSSLPGETVSVQFKIMYALLLVGSVLIGFIKPKQEYQALTEKKVDHLSGRLDYQEGELTKALDLKNEFICNISHEYHAPMTGVISTAETLWEAYENLPDKMPKEAAENIYRSMIKLNHFDNNINSLAQLASPKHTLRKECVNLSELVENRVNECIKLYVGNLDKDRRNFIINIEPKLKVNCDEYYITKTLDNLIINAIVYCKTGNITVTLIKRNDSRVEFRIEDEGIGIPIVDLINIMYIAT